MYSTLDWTKAQIQFIEQRLSILTFGSSDSRRAKGEKVHLLLLRMQFENMLKDATLKFSQLIETNVDFETPVIDFVASCMIGPALPESVSAEEVIETLDTISSFEDKQDEEVDVDIDEDIDEENHS